MPYLNYYTHYYQIIFLIPPKITLINIMLITLIVYYIVSWDYTSKNYLILLYPTLIGFLRLSLIIILLRIPLIPQLRRNHQKNQKNNPLNLLIIIIIIMNEYSWIYYY